MLIRENKKIAQEYCPWASIKYKLMINYSADFC